jgi:predicted nucleotidyltransferase
MKLDQIRETIHGLLPGTRILLFGSRARGDHDAQSDYDLLIITQKKYNEKEKQRWRMQVMVLLVHSFKAPFDILMDDEAEIRENMELPGHIMQTAMREGVEI